MSQPSTEVSLPKAVGVGRRRDRTIRPFRGGGKLFPTKPEPARSTDHHRVVKAAKAWGQKKKEIKRFKDIKALQPGRREDHQGNGDDQGRAALRGGGRQSAGIARGPREEPTDDPGAPPATHHHVAPGMMYHPASQQPLTPSPLGGAPRHHLSRGQPRGRPMRFSAPNPRGDGQFRRRCFNCNEAGHQERDCTLPRRRKF
ncbi:Hypp9686 [Branchiostoma lanceolatum]|uniref:Hypp9686 protein n=1 Tax=Branchiostoma lanceolatum TaxID=7740 RepID=A0A8S4MP17_BRALA|nr:Hypp9686 [Branchiostoma lanceolatum]